MADIVTSGAAAAEAIKWFIDKFIISAQKKKELKGIKKTKVAFYLEDISKLLDLSIEKLKKNELPDREYYELEQISFKLGEVLSTIYTGKDKEFAFEFTGILNTAIHKIIEQDEMDGYILSEPGYLILDLSSKGKPFGNAGEIIIQDLKKTSAIFSAESKRLKAY